MAHRVTLIPGDGIGPEVAAAARLVLDAADVGIEWIERPAGTAALDDYGQLMPEETLDAIRDARVAIKGPITTPVGTGFRSVNVALRQGLDLFGAVRPARALPGVPIRHPSVDLVVIRENTEDLYAGIEFERGSEGAAGLRAELKELGGYDVPEDAGITVKPISVSGTQRIVRFAFEYAKANGRKKVTVGHKANVMRYSDGLFLKTADEIAAEAGGGLEYEAIQIDHLSNRLAHDPDKFDVLLLPNLYGDILSDVCAGLVGGLGLIPGANIGWEYAVFEPVHGSAPDIAGQGLANPIAMILSGAMLLRHVGEPAAAENVGVGGRRGAPARGGPHPRPRRHRHDDGGRRGDRVDRQRVGARPELRSRWGCRDRGHALRNLGSGVTAVTALIEVPRYRRTHVPGRPDRGCGRGQRSSRGGAG